MAIDPSAPTLEQTKTVTVKYTDYGEYQYFGTFVVSFGYRLDINTAPALVKMWANDVLIFGDGAIANPDLTFTFFDGSETQGMIFREMNYRGQICVFFDMMPLKDYGNSLPAITIELSDGSSGDMAVSDVIKAFAIRAGYDEMSISFTGMSAMEVGGYVSGDGSLEQVANGLAQLYGFSWVERADEILFSNKFTDGSSVPDIEATEDQLAQLNEGVSDDIQVVAAERQSDDNFPAKMSISYFDEENKFNPGYQVAGRSKFPASNSSEQRIDINLPITLNGADAIQLINNAIYRVWSAKVGYSVRLPAEFMVLDPGDILQWEYDGDLFKAMVADITINGDNSASVSLSEAGNIQVDVTPTTQPPFARPSAQGKPVRCLVLDIPSLSADEDQQAVLNLKVLMSGFAEDDWGGGYFQMTTTDSPQEWVIKGASTSAALIGTVVDTVGTITDPFVLDETTVLRVSRGSIPLSKFEPATNEEMEDDNKNLMVIGRSGVWELICFGDFAIIDDDIVELSRLYRGRFGTENTVNNHGIGDAIAFLDNAIIVPYTVADYRANRAFLWRALSPKQPVWTVEAKLLVPAGKSRSPYAPVLLTATRMLNGDVSIKWTRRARFYNIPPNDPAISPPLDEPNEQYSIDILNAAATNGLRRVSLGAPEYLYKLSDQMLDKTNAYTELNVLIYQVNSSHTGRGFAAGGKLAVTVPVYIELEGTIDGGGDLHGHIWPPIRLKGTIDGEGDFTGEITRLRKLVGTIDGEGDFTGELTTEHSGSGVITFVSSSHVADRNTTTGPQTLAAPSGMAEGDYMIAVAHVGTPTTNTITPPAGWDLLVTGDNDRVGNVSAYGKFVEASEPSSYVFTCASGQRMGVGIAAFRGVNPTSPYDTIPAASVVNVNTFDHNAPDVTTTNGGAMLFWFASGGWGKVATGVPYTIADGTNLWNIANPTNASTAWCMVAGYQDAGAAGLKTGGAFRPYAGLYKVAGTIALKPIITMP